MNPIRTFIPLLLVLSLMTSWSVQAELSRTDKLKAAYLFNFTKFLQWPDAEGRFAKAEIALCLDGNPEFFDFMQELVKGRKVGVKSLTVKIKPYQERVTCDVAFLVEEYPSLKQSDTPVLLVSDMTNSSLEPSIAFYVVDHKLRFEIDFDAVSDLNLTISSELLKLSRRKSRE